MSWNKFIIIDKALKNLPWCNSFVQGYYLQPHETFVTASICWLSHAANDEEESEESRGQCHVMRLQDDILEVDEEWQNLDHLQYALFLLLFWKTIFYVLCSMGLGILLLLTFDVGFFITYYKKSTALLWTFLCMQGLILCWNRWEWKIQKSIWVRLKMQQLLGSKSFFITSLISPHQEKKLS